MSMRFESRHLVAALLSLSSLGLIVTIGNELGWGQRISLPLPQTIPQKMAGVVVPLQPEFSLPPMEQAYAGMLERPLFTPSRRPLPAAGAAEAPSAMRKGQFTLVGVILTSGKNIALLHEIASGKVLRVEQGKEINGMQLEKLEPERVTLRQGDDTEEVVLRIQAAPKPPKTAAAEPPPAQPGAPGVPAPAAQPGQAGQPVAAPAVPPSTAVQEFIARRRALRGR